MDLTAGLARIYIKDLSMLTIVISLLKKLSSIDFCGGNCDSPESNLHNSRRDPKYSHNYSSISTRVSITNTTHVVVGKGLLYTRNQSNIRLISRNCRC